MLYRPIFCCHCGEKITRPKWLPWTSRRFCEFCQVEQMQHELLPKVGAVLAILLGAAGMVSYLSGAGEKDTGTSVKIRRLGHDSNSGPNAQPTAHLSPPTLSPKPHSSDATTSTKLQRGAQAESSTEPVYHCGAKTRKGTPCTRRLKTKGRCWQHTGQPLAEVEDETKHSGRP